MISVRGVSKRYSSQTHIGPVDLEIPQGEVTAIVGLNGAGKSTLLTMVGRLLKLDEGQIFVAGLDVHDANSKDLAKVLAILRQENHFVTRLSVRQFVAFGRFSYTQGRLTPQDEEVISHYIDFLGLKELENRYLDEVSGGQRQKAYVAMVLAQDTDYVLLDELLNNLDVARSVEMLKYLRQTCDEDGKTIVMIMHDINFSAQCANNICAMKEGKVIAFGSAKDIMNSKTLTDISETPIEVIDTKYGPFAICL